MLLLGEPLSHWGDMKLPSVCGGGRTAECQQAFWGERKGCDSSGSDSDPELL